jgi:hypothetical protein
LLFSLSRVPFPNAEGTLRQVSGIPGSGIEWLQARVSELDSAELAPGLGDEPIVRFVWLMAAWTDTRMTFDSERPVALEPTAADEITAECGLLNEIARTDPHLVRGPLDQRRQQWIGTAKRSASAAPPELPRPSFVSADAPSSARPSTKPAGLGIYSSTATNDGRSMWRVFLDIGREASLHPRPWAVWDVRPYGDRPKLCEIDSAETWCELVQAYPTRGDDRLYPDWRAIATEFDGVHMTLAAIVATQGFTFLTSAGPIAAPYWDLETTLWLRWRFESVSLREVIR